MSQLQTDLTWVTQGLGAEVTIPDGPTPIPPIDLPVGDGSLYGLFAIVFAGIIAEMHTGEIMLRRRTYSRLKPWKPAVSSTYQDYELVAYVSERQNTRAGLRS